MDAITVPFELVKKQMVCMSHLFRWLLIDFLTKHLLLQETGTATHSWLVEALSIDKGRQLTPEEVRTIQIASSSIYTGKQDSYTSFNF